MAKNWIDFRELDGNISEAKSIRAKDITMVSYVEREDGCFSIFATAFGEKHLHAIVETDAEAKNQVNGLLEEINEVEDRLRRS